MSDASAPKKPSPRAARVVAAVVLVAVGAPAVLGLAYGSLWVCVQLVRLIVRLIGGLFGG
jgi:hypothetical protein